MSDAEKNLWTALIVVALVAFGSVVWNVCQWNIARSVRWNQVNAKHTPGKLKVIQNPTDLGPEIGWEAVPVEDTAPLDDPHRVVVCDFHPLVCAKDNARRAVACWNGCDGINPDAVPDLLAALRSLNRSTHGYCVCGRMDGEAERSQHAPFCISARAAIAKASGEGRQ